MDPVTGADQQPESPWPLKLPHDGEYYRPHGDCGWCLYTVSLTTYQGAHSVIRHGHQGKVLATRAKTAAAAVRIIQADHQTTPRPRSDTRDDPTD